MKNYKLLIIAANLLLLFVFLGVSLRTKEQTINNGKLVLLALAPVDPRSLMQGDYMDLRYAIADSVESDRPPKHGYCVIKVDNQQVAQLQRVQATTQPLAADELLLKYTRTNYRIRIGAESFFFEEGQAQKFEAAKYGALRIDADGNSVLVGLYNAKKMWIQ